MANYSEALCLLLAIERGYNCDPDDPGGETYKGIARAYWPQWSGWQLLDAHKAADAFPQSMNGDAALATLVDHFYWDTFWLRVWGDRIADQPVAAELFEQAVNLGVTPAVMHLQRALNALNRNQRDYFDVVVDGTFGPRTFATLESCCADDDGIAALVKLLNTLQGAYYLALMESNPAREKWRGWFART